MKILHIKGIIRAESDIMKKLVSLITAVLIVATLFVTVPASAKTLTYKDFEYKVSGSTVIVLKYKGSSASVTIPSKIDGKKVVKIAKTAFNKNYPNEANTTLKSVKIPDTVTAIGSAAFAKCKKLSKVTFGKNVRNIADSVFCECSSLKSVKLPDSLVKLGECCFMTSGLKYITIPAKVRSISMNTFDCHYLEKISVNKNNKKYSSSNGMLYNKSKSKLLFCPRAIQSKTIKVSSSTRVIGTYSLFNIKNATALRLPSKLQKIEDFGVYLFEYRSLTVPASVNELGINSIISTSKNFTMRGKKGSAAEKYAKIYEYRFIAI